MIRVLRKASENYPQLLSKAEWVHEENIKVEGGEGERGMPLRNENTDSHIIAEAPPCLATVTPSLRHYGNSTPFLCHSRST